MQVLAAADPTKVADVLSPQPAPKQLRRGKPPRPSIKPAQGPPTAPGQQPDAAHAAAPATAVRRGLSLAVDSLAACMAALAPSAALSAAPSAATSHAEQPAAPSEPWAEAGASAPAAGSQQRGPPGSSQPPAAEPRGLPKRGSPAGVSGIPGRQHATAARPTSANGSRTASPDQQLSSVAQSLTGSQQACVGQQVPSASASRTASPNQQLASAARFPTGSPQACVSQQTSSHQTAGDLSSPKASGGFQKSSPTAAEKLHSKPLPNGVAAKPAGRLKPAQSPQAGAQPLTARAAASSAAPGAAGRLPRPSPTAAGTPHSKGPANGSIPKPASILLSARRFQAGAQSLAARAFDVLPRYGAVAGLHRASPAAAAATSSSHSPATGMAAKPAGILLSTKRPQTAAASPAAGDSHGISSKGPSSTPAGSSSSPLPTSRLSAKPWSVLLSARSPQAGATSPAGVNGSQSAGPASQSQRSSPNTAGASRRTPPVSHADCVSPSASKPPGGGQTSAAELQGPDSSNSLLGRHVGPHHMHKAGSGQNVPLQRQKVQQQQQL